MLKSYQSRALCVGDRVYVVTHRIIVLAPVPLTTWDLLGLRTYWDLVWVGPAGLGPKGFGPELEKSSCDF